VAGGEGHDVLNIFFDRNWGDCTRNLVQGRKRSQRRMYTDGEKKLKGCEESLYGLGNAVVLL
jgi:hypothetical protein